MNQRPAWHGGNKIPASYIKKFAPSQGKEAHPDMPYDLRLFMNQLGGKDD